MKPQSTVSLYNRLINAINKRFWLEREEEWGDGEIMKT
jgi:hypothetical protein